MLTTLQVQPGRNVSNVSSSMWLAISRVATNGFSLIICVFILVIEMQYIILALFIFFPAWKHYNGISLSWFQH